LITSTKYSEIVGNGIVVNSEHQRN